MFKRAAFILLTMSLCQGMPGVAIEPEGRTIRIPLARMPLADQMKDWDMQLIKAIYENDIATVKAHIDAGADVNTCNVHGATLLAAAVVCGKNTEIVDLLIEAGANVNAKDESGRTPLFCATFLKKPEMAQVLVNAGADVNVQDKEGKTALMLTGDLVLRSHCKSIKVPAMFSKEGFKETVQILLAAGADVNLQDKKKCTALFELLKVADAEVVQALLAAGADVNLQEENALTPLFVIMGNPSDDKEITKLLIEAGANINLQASEKLGRVTPLMQAIHGGHTESAKLLIEAGASVNIQVVDGMTALMLAAQKGNTEVVKSLIKAGADILVKNDSGATALQIARKSNHKEAARALIAAGAEPGKLAACKRWFQGE